MYVTTTTERPNVKYITRPKPEPRLYACDLCDVHVKLYVEPVEVLHRCIRTRKTARLTERPLGWKRTA
jgi:hypothetical protein